MIEIMALSTAAMLTGYILDLIFGDPQWFPHIVRLIGAFVSTLEKVLRKLLPSGAKGERLGGVILVCTVTLTCVGVTFLILFLCYRLWLPLGYVLESFLCYQLLSVKSLRTESMKVYHSINDIGAARKNLSMIVGRDTSVLDRDGVIRAAVETVAENTSDGVTAPILYIGFGGAATGLLYKAVNTMDSMVGYQNGRYINFGRAAAKTDDAFNFLPARICALIMVTGAFFLGLDYKKAFYIWKRDRLKHASPNSAQTESVCAGALGVRLAGPVSYMDAYVPVVHNKPYIGDDTRPVCDDDIVASNRLMYAASLLTLILALMIRGLLMGAVMYAKV